MEIILLLPLLILVLFGGYHVAAAGKHGGLKHTGYSRNGAIEFFRYLFTLVIILLHFRDGKLFGSQPTAFYGGYLGVEFFFIVTGFYLAAHFDKGQDQEPLEERWRIYRQYLWHRIKSLYPLYLLALSLLIALRVLVIKNLSLKSVLIKHFYELFMLQETGLASGTINGPAWFVSVLFIVSAIVTYLLLFHKHLFLNLLAPFFSFGVLGYLHQTAGHVDVTAWDTGNLRAICEISLGCLIYQLYQWSSKSVRPQIIRKKAWRQAEFTVYSLLEILLTGLVLFVMWRTRRDYKDFVMVPVIGLFVFCLMQKRGVLSRWLDRPFSRQLGKISYATYLVQKIPMTAVQYYFYESRFYWYYAGFVLAASTLLGIFSMWLIRKLSAKFSGCFSALEN